MPVIFRNGRPMVVAANDPALASPPPEPRPARPIRKTLVVRRLTRDEIAAADAFFATPEGLFAKYLWQSADATIDPNDAETVGMFTALYGATRTAELLAPE
jgi:hypothetical protein